MADTAPADMSKSAKKRAAKKVRDAAHEEAEEVAAPPPAAAAKAKGKAKAQEPLPLPPQPKAKAKGKAAPEPPQPEPKAKAKGKAKAQPEPPAPEPKAKAKAKAEPTREPAPAPKAEGKKKSKAAKPAKQEEEEEPVKPKQEEIINYVIDDGSGPSWEQSSGLSKKQEKRQKKVEQLAGQLKASNGKPIVQQYVVGMAPQGAAQGASATAGASQSVAADIKRILALKAEGTAAAEQQAEAQANLSTVTMMVPEKRIGVVIGPKGANIKMLQEKTGVARVDTSGQIFTISGEPKNVAECQNAIQELVDKGYCSMMFENFGENMMNIHPTAFPDLIGKEGCVVRKIKEALKVEVNFQDIGKGAPAGKKAKVTLAGSAANVEQAKNVINNIVMYGHDELTHPGVVHEELDIEEWQYRFIIGKGGSEMKHIQNNYKVKVNIPREHAATDKVIVVGERDGVERAKVYIEKVIWNAEDASKGRDRVDKAVDPWGEEEEEEPWMKQYMYRR